MSDSHAVEVSSNRSELQTEVDPGDVFLVVGDWFVDEHWVCGVHRSSSSSRTGRSHVRALHSAHSTVRAFCGAGRSAQFLHQLYQNSGSNESQTSVIGLGFWHRADTEALRSLFDFRSPSQTPFRLTPPEPNAPQGIELINMNDALNLPDGKRSEEEQIRYRDSREYTTRVIRIYTHGEQDKVEYDRIDWERRAPAKVRWKDTNRAALLELLEKQLKGRSVRAILIKDLQKGVINDEIIDWLVEWDRRRSPWFVSTKKWGPDWLDGLGSRVDLRLVMIPQVTAQVAIHEKRQKEQKLRQDQKLSRWITRSGKPSKEAIDLIDKFAGFSRAKNIFVLPDGFSAIACECNDDRITTSVIQSDVKPEKVTVEMGYASILFPALVACLSLNPKQRIDKNLMSLSLRAAYEWIEFEAQRVFHPTDWNANLDWSKNWVLDSMRKFVPEPYQLNDIPKFGDIRDCDWNEERTQWDQAFKGVGVIGARGEKDRKLELWRAMIEVDGYVCCEASTRKELKELLHGVQVFSKHPRHHASCMLLASPGSGKTYLAKRLAETANLRFLPFNITQMRSKGDILECLDTIVATQAENNRQPLMVFIDEINAKLENASVYGAFLTPLEDGTYVRSGRTFNIKPCMWVFAGTRHPKFEDAVSVDGNRRLQATPEKGSDFVSRLTLEVLKLTSTDGQQGHDSAAIKDEEILATEKVYLGACMLRHEFPDVRRVSEHVLSAFRELPLSTTVREIKHFVRRFSDIQYGEVTSRSVPDRWPEDSPDARIQNGWLQEVRNHAELDKPDISIVTGAESERGFDSFPVSKAAKLSAGA